LGGAYATYSGLHIRIDAETLAVSARRRMVLRVLTTVGALAIVTMFFIAAVGFYHVTLEEAGEASQQEQLFTPARGALVIILGYGAIAFHFLVQIALDVGWLLSKDPPPPEWVADAGAH
jgi:TRAP-type C4-dicarboxylate transport system permease small subunit